VLVAVPCQDQCSSWFAYDLARLVGYSVAAGVEVNCALVKTAYLPSSRSLLAEMGLRAGTSHILWLDSDMRFPKDGLVRLLKHKEPIVGASYSMRRMPLGPVAYKGYDQTEPVFIPNDATGLLRVGMVGFGFMLTETRVFDVMPKPWFANPYRPELDDFEGEDVWFCKKAKEQGFQVMVDQGLTNEVDHLGEWAFSNAQLNSYHESAQTEGLAETVVTT
jgi:hypothetical protein